MFNLLIMMLIAYLLGSVMGGDILRAVLGGQDLRRSGSGNVGATNALRTRGVGFALGVLVFDVTKGVLATLLVPFLQWAWIGPVLLDQRVIACICGGAVAIGHCYPVFYRFRGGKGVATLTGVFGVLVPFALIWGLFGFVLILLLTGYVSLSSLAAATAVVIWIAIHSPDGGPGTPVGYLALCMLVLLTWKHRKNIVRLISHTEPKFDNARVIGRVLDKWIHR